MTGKFLRVGVTGGIGSGKSTVCAIFQSLGRTLLPADLIAREVIETNDVVRNKIRNLFGEGSFGPDGTLDRPRLANIVFADPRARGKLDAIVHPEVFRELERRIGDLPEEQKRPYVLIEAALIFETGMQKRLDRVIVVSASEEVRIARVVARDGSTRGEVVRRMHAQVSAARAAALADFVIVNEQNATGLETKVRFVDSLLSRI